MVIRLQCDVKLPLPIIKEHDGINVVRDDLLDSGTKRRIYNMSISLQIQKVCLPFRTRLCQLSLAYIKDLGRKCTVTVPKGEKTWLTIESERLGANVIQVPMGYLSNIQHKAKVYCEENGAHLIPFGGDHPIIIEAMCRAALSLESIKRFVHPKEVWTVMSSGVLSRGLQMAWPKAKVYGVQIGHNTTEDEMGRAETFRSKYKFHQECKKETTFPKFTNL